MFDFGGSLGALPGLLEVVLWSIGDRLVFSIEIGDNVLGFLHSVEIIHFVKPSLEPKISGLVVI